MRFSSLAAHVAVACLASTATAISPLAFRDVAPIESRHAKVIQPKVFIVNLFTSEADVWYNIPEFNVLAHNITVVGLSPRFPKVHCTADGEICQITLGEGKINAAASAQALTLCPEFDLRTTYFMVAGIAGGTPKHITLNSAAFIRFAVETDLQYEIDSVELGGLFKTGYIPYGTTAPAPAQYPANVYGTEVFEINQALQKRAIAFGSQAKLQDSPESIAYRAKYPEAIARAPPAVVACDAATSDVYFSGSVLGDAAANFTTLMTNGTGVYCVGAQEDAALLESLLRSAKAGKVDFSRIMVMRTAADFDRPPPGETAYHHLIDSAAGAFPPSLANLHLVGVKVVQGILREWEPIYKNGIKPTNYIGDIFGTLGGIPDFGPYPYFGEA